jgi:hypothetical protein
MGEGNENLVYLYPFDFKSFFLYAVKSYDMGPPALLLIRKKDVLLIFVSIKFHRLGRVRTRKLCVQWQAH